MLYGPEAEQSYQLHPLAEKVPPHLLEPNKPSAEQEQTDAEFTRAVEKGDRTIIENLWSASSFKAKISLLPQMVEKGYTELALEILHSLLEAIPSLTEQLKAGNIHVPFQSSFAELLTETHLPQRQLELFNLGLIFKQCEMTFLHAAQFNQPAIIKFLDKALGVYIKNELVEKSFTEAVDNLHVAVIAVLYKRWPDQFKVEKYPAEKMMALSNRCSPKMASLKEKLLSACQKNGVPEQRERRQLTPIITRAGSSMSAPLSSPIASPLATRTTQYTPSYNQVMINNPPLKNVTPTHSPQSRRIAMWTGTGRPLI